MCSTSSRAKTCPRTVACMRFSDDSLMTVTISLWGLLAFEPGYYVSGIESGYAQEILYRARIYPKRNLVSLTLNEQKSCYRNVNTVTREALCKGSRSSEVDLCARPGGFVPHVCEDKPGQPRREGGTAIEKLIFEGGSCYVCPEGQR